jgi:hypothetical protein
MKGNIHNYALHITGNKWERKGVVVSEKEKRNLRNWLLCIPGTGRPPLHIARLARPASYVYDKAENKCTD